MERSIVLVIGLGRIEGLQGNDLGRDRALVDPGFVELCDVRLGNPLLLVGAIENGRTILRAQVWTLPIQLRRVVSHRKEDAKQLAVSDFGWIVCNFDRLRMAGLAGADEFVFRGLGCATGIGLLRLATSEGNWCSRSLSLPFDRSGCGCHTVTIPMPEHLQHYKGCGRDSSSPQSNNATYLHISVRQVELLQALRC